MFGGAKNAISIDENCKDSRDRLAIKKTGLNPGGIALAKRRSPDEPVNGSLKMSTYVLQEQGKG